MSIELSRRDFMKCSAVAALAVASGTLLTGCGGGGGASNIPADRPVTAKGVTVEMERYDDPIHLIGGFYHKDVIPLGSKYELVEINFEVENNSDAPVTIVNGLSESVGNVVIALGQCIKDKSPEALESLKKSRNFDVSADNGSVSSIDFVNLEFNGDFDPATLAPGEDTDIHLLCVAPAGWKTLNIRYNKLGLNFVQSR